MSMTHPAIVNDDGSLTIGTVWNDAWEAAHDTAIDAAIAASAALAPVLPGSLAPTTTGTQTALALPAGTGDLVLYLNNATLLTIQGIAAGLQGQRLTLISKGAGHVDLAHLHASGTALGKLKLFATTGLTSLAAGVGVAVFQYDATVTQWRLVVHEQGAWITPAFAAGDYTAATGTWTVQAGDVATFKYRLSGRSLAIRMSLLTTDVSATPASLNRVIPGGFTAAGSLFTYTRVSNAGAAAAVGLVFPTSTSLQFYSDNAGAGWAIATANTRVDGDFAVDVA